MRELHSVTVVGLHYSDAIDDVLRAAADGSFITCE